MTRERTSVMFHLRKGLIRPAALALTTAVAAALIGGGPTAAAAPPDGVKPTVVLVHGAWADASSWDGETNGSLSGSDSTLAHEPKSELFDVPYPGAPDDAVDLYLKKDEFLHYFGSDLPTEVAPRLWATQRAASTSAFETPSRFAAWETIPS